MARYHAPLDPSCPEVVKHHAKFEDDPMSKYAPLDDFYEAFEKKHRPACERCKEYGAANIDVV